MVLNPVERRLVDICKDWLIFRDEPGPGVLVWEAPGNAQRLVRAFFESQKYETAYSSGDLFIVFEAPFANAIQYSRELKRELAGQYEASRDDLRAQGEAADWAFEAEALPDSPEGVVAALRSFGSKYAERIGTLAVVLLPLAVGNGEAFAQWLKRAVDTELPRRLRFVMLDAPESRELAALDALGEARIARRPLQLDGFDLAQETFAQEPTQGPAGVFRNQLTALVALVEKGSAEQVKAKALDALAFVQQHKWKDQEVVVRLLVAGALLKESRHAEAVAVYQASRQVAGQALAAAHPAGRKLVLQTWFGQAAAHLAAGQTPEAAACYRDAAAVAQADHNLILTIEAQRMEAFCRARDGDRIGALACGQQALASGARLKPEVRSMTTLPIAAMDLLRVCDPARTAQIEQLKQRLDQGLATLEAEAENRAGAEGAGISHEAAAAIEQQLAAASHQADSAAEAHLAALVAEGDDDYRHSFAHARELLGADWPLIGGAAIPAPPPAAEGAPV